MRRLFGTLASLAFVVGSIVLLVRAMDRPIDGPSPVAWDREACAHCRMLVSEKRFAAQIVEGHRALHFDDPGCLFEHLRAAGEPRGKLWFHHLSEDRWLAGDQVGFVAASPTPMGYGLGAVDAGAPGALSLAEARRKALAAR
jgi:hypothetical protein